MSRLTGSDALGLFEAYQTIYTPQEITEEQVWEEVECWVNNLIEEGYDLSDYTWEEMYESYDYYNTIVCYLLDEGYADTNEAALAIMANMSEEWKQSILSEDPVQDLRDRELAAGQKGSERSHAASGGNGGVKKTSKKSPSVGTGPQNNFGRGF